MFESDLAKIALLPGFQFFAKSSSGETFAKPPSFEEPFISNSDVTETSRTPDAFADPKPDVFVETSDRDISIGSGVAALPNLDFESTSSKRTSTVASRAFTDSITMSTAEKNLSLSSTENLAFNSLVRDVKSASKKDDFKLDIILKNDKLKVALPCLAIITKFYDSCGQEKHITMTFNN
jgi:hypothetical protein